jgi:transposase InsO family protein
MSAKGYCYDNAFMESWFKTLKQPSFCKFLNQV